MRNTRLASYAPNPTYRTFQFLEYGGDLIFLKLTLTREVVVQVQPKLRRLDGVKWIEDKNYGVPTFELYQEVLVVGSRRS
jgi:hypothetical protein